MAPKLKKSIINVSQLVSGDIFAKLIGMFVLVFYVRYLPKEYLALLPVYGILTGMSTLIFSFGIFPTLVRSLPSMLKENLDEARAMIFTSSIIILGGAGVFASSVFFLSENVSEILLKSHAHSNLIKGMSVGLFAAGIIRVSDYVLWSSSRFSRMTIIKMTNALMTALITVSLVLILGVKGLILGMVIRDITCAFLSLFFLKDIIFTKSLRLYPARKLLKDSFPFYMEAYLFYFKNQKTTRRGGINLLTIYYYLFLSIFIFTK